MAMSIRPVPTAGGMSRIVSLRDIEDEITSRLRLEFALGHDQLTELANRDMIQSRVQYLHGQLRPGAWIAVLCVGIDSLGEINEALGHAAGDAVLTSVAARIVETIGSPDAVGRGSGNELLVILADLATGADAAQPAEQLRLAAQQPMHIDGQSLTATVSIGIATGTVDVPPDQLLREASLAMRKAKALGRNQFVFAEPSLAVEAEHRLGVEAAIREGLAAGQFEPWFQPIVELAHGEVVGYEALARWVAPGDTRLPDDFIAVAARSSLITELDLAMLDPVVQAITRLPAPQFIALNVTGQTLARSGYADRVAASLARHGVDPRRLHLEVTETMLLSLDDDLITEMRTLAELGCRWYVDDFGTGYSSISHLRDLPVRGLKLDKSFTDGIAAGDETSRQLADALIGLANGLGLDTVAEGIETEAQERYLRTLGWRHGQGWLFGKATPL
jgi:diguanylate cyclase (GGDEF)-like protein